jgi:uncharacterized RDD family membrane protein YckC
MTCQFCQTWNTDDDHRCRRCGRRIRTSPGRISPRTYPIAATATAPQIEFESTPQNIIRPDASLLADQDRPEPAFSPQPMLFDAPVNAPRVISFDSITSPLEREAIRARAAGLSRPAPHKVEKVEASPRQTRRSSSARADRSPEHQQAFDFLAQQEVVRPSASTIICDCPVARPGMRLTASLIDAVITLSGTLLAMVPIWFGTHALALDKRTLVVIGIVTLVIAAGYRFLWIAAGRDSIGMSLAHVRLVDFFGRTPARQFRYLRLFGGILSVLGAGLGLVWSLVDQEGLTWSDHISGTFPTPDEP